MRQTGKANHVPTSPNPRKLPRIQLSGNETMKYATKAAHIMLLISPSPRKALARQHWKASLIWYNISGMIVIATSRHTSSSAVNIEPTMCLSRKTGIIIHTAIVMMMKNPDFVTSTIDFVSCKPTK